MVPSDNRATLAQDTVLFGENALCHVLISGNADKAREQATLAAHAANALAEAEAKMAANPWRIAQWEDAQGQPVQTLGFHASDLEAVMALPFPAEAAARVPVVRYTGVEHVTSWYKQKNPINVGDAFDEEINQGIRDCVVVAVDDATGRYLYEYGMPNGTSALRRENGKSVSYRSLAAFWLKLIEEQTGLVNLIARPQSGGHNLNLAQRLLEA